MSLRSCIFVFFIDLDGLVTLGSDHSQGTAVELDIEYAGFAGERTWLHSGLDLLEVVAACPIEETEGSIVCTTDKHVVFVDC